MSPLFVFLVLLFFSQSYTNPNDQSVWLYAFWLLGRASSATAEQRAALAGHCAQLQALDGPSKWPLLAELRLGVAPDPAAHAAALARADPARARYYATLGR